MILYFLPAIIALGLITSYEDLKTGKIKNIYVFSAIIYTIIINAAIIIWYAVSPERIVSSHYIIELFTNFAFAFIAAFILWEIGGWTAGDAKLFIAFAALIPFSAYSYGYQEWTPSVILLTNIFVCALVPMIIYMSFKIEKKHLRQCMRPALKEIFSPIAILSGTVVIFGMVWIVSTILRYISLGNNSMMTIFLTIAISFLISRKIGKKSLFIFIGIAVVRLLIDKDVYSINFLTRFIILISIWVILRGFLSESLIRLGQDIFTKDIPISELKAGMKPSEYMTYAGELEDPNVYINAKQKGWKIIAFRNFAYYVKPLSFIDPNKEKTPFPDGFTEEGIIRLKKIGLKTVKISQTLPFAPFIFLGALITILAKGNILIIFFKIFMP